MGQQMTIMIRKMDKLEQQNEYLLKEMRRLKKGGSSQLRLQKRIESESVSKWRKRKAEESPESSSELSSTDSEAEQALANWPLNSLEEIDEVIEKMKKPEYYQTLVSVHTYVLKEYTIMRG